MSAAVAMSRGGSRRGGLQLDPLLVGIVMSIMLLGLVMLASASMPVGSHDSGDPFIFVKKQSVLALGGLVVAALLCAIPTGLYQKYANAMLIAAAALLVAVFIPGLGYKSHGAQRWLDLRFVSLQASELTRVMVLCWIASYAVRREEELRESFSGLARPLLIVAVFCVLLLLEPDFGAAAVLFATAFGLLFLAGARLRWLVLTIVGAPVVFAALVKVAPYRMERVLCIFNLWEHARDCGYQAVNAQIAIGRGEWLGVGLGNSVQKLFYLPEAHTDFVFAVLGEELGLAGVLLTLALFMALVWRVLHVARQAAEAGMKFQSYLAGAFAIWVGVQALINIGVNMGALPTKGLTLPFMSYGRSSLLVTLAWLGIVLRIHHEVTVRGRGSASGSRRDAAGAEA